MSEKVYEYGGRIRVRPFAASTELSAFGTGVARRPEVRRALGTGRWRLLHVAPYHEPAKEDQPPGPPTGEAVFFDYSKNRSISAEGRLDGRGPLKVTASNRQPVPSPEEFREAVELVAQSPVWGPLLRSGSVAPYTPMPPMLEPSADEDVERTLYVGLLSRPRRFNRIVAVNMLRREVSRKEVVPPHSRALGETCGVPFASCNRPARGTPGRLLVEWPAADPVWRFEVIRPAASSGTNGSGVELLNVFFRGVKVLDQAHMPILNVQYDEDACGPYRDWLYEEWCFQAVGDSIPGVSGFRWCTQQPQTIFESGQDGGNFVGVALFEDPSDGALSILSQTSAGWYRYVMEWRFYADGRIVPLFRFGGVRNSCVCEAHNHHAYWRLNFAVNGNKNILQESVDGGSWKSVRREAARTRVAGQELRWRVLDRRARFGYEIIPGPFDDVGDPFSGQDQYLLRFKKNEIDDGHSLVGGGAKAELAGFVRRQVVFRKDLVVWYAAHFRHIEDPETADHDSVVGPTLQPINWPGG
jgi:hypothetical protein